MDYNYQLTEWVEDKKKLRSVIRQIEVYEGKGEGYEVKPGSLNKCLVWAVFTTGELRADDSLDGLSCASIGGNLCSTPRTTSKA